MSLLRLLWHAPILFIVLVVPMLYSVIAHEVAHGWCALAFGDETAKRHGRLTLNPLAHISLVGTLMLFVVGFGWAKPVPVNYAALRWTRLGSFCVALAGCATNVLIAVIAIAVLQSGLVRPDSIGSVTLQVLARVNTMLGAFNLIPIPPLDGSKVLMSFLPEAARRSFAWLERFGFLILVLLLSTGWLDPVIAFMERLIYGFIGIVFHQ